MDAFLNNVQIINSFNKYDDIKKNTDYINRNIFNHLNTEEDYTTTDKFINFDVTYKRCYYEVIIILKAHRSLVNTKDSVNCLDVMCESIREIVDEIYPYHVSYFDRPVRRGDYYVERQIGFTLSVNDKQKDEKKHFEKQKETVTVKTQSKENTINENLLILNKKGYAEIECNKKMNVIKAGFSPTRLTAKFNNLIDSNNKITPVWIVECDNIEHYDIKVSDDSQELYISTIYDHAGDFVKVTLIDKEQNYVGASIYLEVITL